MPETITTIPEDLTVLNDEELASLHSELTEEFDRLLDEGCQDVPLMTGLADSIDAVAAERQGRIAAAEEARAAIDALAQRVHPPEDSTTEPEIAPDEQAENSDEDEEDEEAETEEQQGELVTTAAASPARRPTAAAVAARTRRPSLPVRPRVNITAAADVPGVSTGQRIDVLRMAQGMHDKARGLNNGSPRVPVAQISIPTEVWLTEDPTRNARLLAELIDDRLHGSKATAALVASGGWCVPSTPIYDLFEIGDTDGFIDLPSVGVVRGGVLVPTFYMWTDTSAAYFNWTEANDIAAATQPTGPDKPCLKIPCPTWTDMRLEAEGLCITHGNLSDRAFPELTRSFVNLAMAGHQRRMSAAKTAKIVADAIAVTPDASMLVSDAAGDILGNLELQAADLRSQYRASRTRSVDVLLPDWIVPALRSNVAMRAGVDLLSVSDAEVVGWLTARNIRPQFLADYQPLYNTTPAVKWPAAAEFTMFFTGSYVEGTGGTIDLGVVRDSILNSTNDFTAAWTETFFTVVRRGPRARKASVTLTVNGVTACCPTV